MREGILGGTWHRTARELHGRRGIAYGEVVKLPNIAPTIDGFEGDRRSLASPRLNNVDVVITRQVQVDALPGTEQSVEELAQNSGEKLACAAIRQSIRTAAPRSGRLQRR